MRKKNRQAGNFLADLNIKTKRKDKRKVLKYLAIFIFIFLGLLGLFIAFYYPTAKKAYLAALGGKDNLMKAQESIQRQDYSEAEKFIQESHDDFETAAADFKKLSFLKYLPIISQQYQAVNIVIDIGAEITESTKGVISLAVDIITPFKNNTKISLADISTREKREILGKIYASEGLFERLRVSIDNAEEKIINLPDKGLIGPVKETVLILKDYLPRTKEAVDKLSVLTKVLPDIAGYPESRKFFFLLQNNSELRPTGGFIGTYGTLEVKDAEIQYFSTDNIYNLDEKAEDLSVVPPMPLTRYNKVEKWYLRDSNWSPDFPTAAEKALWFYEKESGQKANFNGVIAITPTLIESLISLTGPIEVYGIKFTADNFIDTLQYQVEKGFYQKGLEESERKEIIGDLSKILIDRIFSLPQEKWDDLFQILDKNLREKHILFYFKNTNSENFIKQNNWGGHIIQNIGDYFMLVDANLGSLKTDPHVKRTLKYSLREENKKLIASLEVIYYNQGSFTWKTTRYRSYFRLYVPQGSKLIDIIGTNEEKKVENELGKTSFGSFVSVEPQEEKKIIFRYELPERVYQLLNSKNYQLIVQKQAGTANYDITLDLNFSRKIKEMNNIDNFRKESDNRITFSGKLDRDLIFNLKLK